MIWLRRALLLLAFLVVLLAGLLAIAYYTPLGLRIAASVAESRLPALQIGEVNGSLSGGLRLSSLRYDKAGLVVALDKLELDGEWTQLLDRKLLINKLSLQRAEIQWPEAEPSAETPTVDWREPLPALTLPELPFAIDLQEVQVGQISFGQGEARQALREIRLSATVNERSDIDLKRISLQHQGYGSLTGAAVFAEQQLRIETLQWRGPEKQQLTVTGRVSPFGRNAEADLRLQWQQLSWPSLSELALPQGEAHLQGWLQNYQLTLDTRLDDGQRSASLKTQLAGDLQGLRVNTFSLGDTTQPGLEQLRLNGELDWRQDVQWQFAVQGSGLDLAIIHPQWPSQLQLDADSKGRLYQDGGRWLADQLSADIRQLDGQIRGQNISAMGSLKSADRRTIDGQLSVQSGSDSAQVQGKLSLVGGNNDVRLQLTVDQIADWWPQAAGSISADMQVSGALDKPSLSATLTGQQLRVANAQLSIDRVQLNATIEQGRRGQAFLQLDQLQQAEQTLETLQLELAGALASHEVKIRAQQVDAETHISFAGGLSPATAAVPWRWQGQLADWVLNLNEGSGQAAGQWQLLAPADLRISSEQQVLQRSCLAQGEQRLCLSGSHMQGQRVKAEVSLEKLPLTLLQGLAQASSRPSAVAVRGVLDARADITWALENRLPRLDVELVTQGAAISLVRRPDLGWLSLDKLTARARASEESAEIQIDSQLQPQGRLLANLTLPTLSDDLSTSPVDGRLELEIDDLKWLELLLPELVDASGRLSMTGRAEGPLNELDLAGELRLQDFAGELPAVALKLSEGQLSLSGDLKQQQAQLNGRVRSGDGQLLLDGTLGLSADQGLPLRLRVQGDRMLAADTDLISLEVSPDLTLEGPLNQSLRLSGSLDVDRLALDLERRESTTRPSEDVVFVDQSGLDEPTKQPPGPTLRANVTVGLGTGEAVTLSGFGLEAKLGGALDVRLPEQGDATASGQLSVNGRYRSWGQNLQVDNGRLIYSDVALGNPALDIRAYRPLVDVTAGVHLTGSANNPQLDLYAEPTMADADILSYIITGRPVEAVGEQTGDQQQQLTSAALAYGINAASLPSKLGLDVVEISDRPDLGGSTLMVGKRLSPRLVLSYATSLFSSESLLQLRYQLSRRWRLRVESSTAESRGTIEYYHES
jgi:translocation and assembly module TamB